MKTLTIKIPENVDLTEKEAAIVLAAQLYETGKLSLGQAAKLAGYSKRTFIELLADYGVSVFNYGPDELERDINNARDYNK
jgi:predicted HTH domain antitoxin